MVQLKSLGMDELIEMAIKEPGKVSGCYSLFHDYSWKNAFLLSLQQAELGLKISPVASGSKWVKNGFISDDTNRRLYTKKLWAYVPVEFSVDKTDKDGNKILDADGKPLQVKGIRFKLVKAFVSYSQIENKLLKEFKPKCDIDVNGMLNILGLSLTDYNTIDGNCQGYCTPINGRIAINPIAENFQKTLLHEVAHCLLHKATPKFTDSLMIDKCIKEAEAETTAYIVSIMLGCDNETTLSHSRGYIQSWLNGKELKPFNVKRIVKAVDIILKAIANHKGDYKKQVAKDIQALNDIKEGD